MKHTLDELVAMLEAGRSSWLSHLIPDIEAITDPVKLSTLVRENETIRWASRGRLMKFWLANRLAVAIVGGMISAISSLRSI